MITADIYAIENIVTNGVYIGSSLCHIKRWRRHRRDLNGGVHHSVHLQRAWNKYGEESFILHLLEKVDKKGRLQAEQDYLDHRKDNYNESLNYNVLWVAGSCSGRVFSPESLKKMSDSHKGMIPSPEQLKKQSEYWDRVAKESVLVDPHGKHHTFRAVRPFARKHGLASGQVGKLLKGEVRHHNGWTRTDSHHYVITSPAGVEHKVLILKYFCKDNNLDYRSMHSLVVGKRTSFQGWTCKCPTVHRAVTHG